MSDDADSMRIDKWLWAARFFKTRALAATAVTGGKVKVNGERAKAAKAIRAGDTLLIHIGPYEHAVHVLALDPRRGPAAAAAKLYEETPESRAARELLSRQMAAQRQQVQFSAERPDTRERRQMIRFKRSQRQPGS